MWQGRNVNIHVYTHQGLAYAAKKKMMMMMMVIAKHRNERYTEYWNEYLEGEVVWSVTIEMPNKWRWGWGGFNGYLSSGEGPIYRTFHFMIYDHDIDWTTVQYTYAGYIAVFFLNDLVQMHDPCNLWPDLHTYSTLTQSYQQGNCRDFNNRIIVIPIRYHYISTAATSDWQFYIDNTDGDLFGD